MNFCIAVPVHQGSIRGNEVTALRWKSILEQLQHGVQIVHGDDPLPDSECLIAIHAIRSHDAICRYRKKHAGRPVIVCLSGTDLHGVFTDPTIRETVGAIPSRSAISNRRLALESLELADIILLLEPMGKRKLPLDLQSKCHVIFQSASEVLCKDPVDAANFQVSLIGHLRHQKDPMLAARATRLLPANSKIRLVHVGDILEDCYVAKVGQEVKENPRYHWLGKLDHEAAMQILVSSQLTLLTSVQEGAPSIVSEAVVNEIPILATRIDASLGMLGDDYPGLFPTGDEKALASLMLQAEQNTEFLNRLRQATIARKTRFTRDSELRAWRQLISMLDISA